MSIHWPLLTFLPGKEAILPQQLYALPWKATALPVSRHQVVFLVWQLLTFLPGKEAILPWQLYTLPRKVTALPLSRHQVVFLVQQLLTFLLGKEAVLSQELYTFPRKMSAHPRLLPSVCTVREIAPLNPLAPPGQGRVITPQGRQAR